jgi:hypothetical protein
MRILVDGIDVHVWALCGVFTIHGDDRVTWRTPREGYRARSNYASLGDDDVCLPPSLAGALPQNKGVVDAVVLDDRRLAVAFLGKPSRVEVIDIESGIVESTIPLIAKGTALPGGPFSGELSDGEDFIGSATRGLRLFACKGGFLVTANESGHVASYSLIERRFKQVFRIPGAPENTIYAARSKENLIVGVKWNGRHSDLFLVSEKAELLAHWPDDGEVRWGIPGLAVVGDHLLTYSDEGPHRGELALLGLADLGELSHLKIPSTPMDLDGAGERFAVLTINHVVTGRVTRGRFHAVRVRSIKDLMAAAGFEPLERLATATDDGRGERVWIERRVDALFVVADKAHIVTDEGALIAIEPTGQWIGNSRGSARCP